MFEAEKYIDDSDILEEEKLSKTDCILIELLIDKSVILVTNNALLKKATTQEAKERNVTVVKFLIRCNSNHCSERFLLYHWNNSLSL